MRSRFLNDRYRKNTVEPHWIEHPHFLDPTDYECSRCCSRFRKMTPACPHCGAVLSGRKKQDNREWEDEEDEFDWLIDSDD